MNTEYAYHNEVTKASGITKNVSTVLKVFGNLSAGAGAATYKHLINDPNLHTNLIALGAGYLGGVFLKRVADEIAQDWKPIVFGEWVKNGVRKLKNEK